jgi:hypothetical protein
MPRAGLLLVFLPGGVPHEMAYIPSCHFIPGCHSRPVLDGNADLGVIPETGTIIQTINHSAPLYEIGDNFGTKVRKIFYPALGGI